MDYTQLKQPNLSVVGKDGYCLAYVTTVFGVANKYPSATVAWADAQFKHPNVQPPTNIDVPVWFKYNGPDGHVAVWAEGKIYSTSAQGDKVFNTIAELVSWMGEGMTYLGWSEDINAVRVVQQGEDMVDDAMARKLLTLSTLMAQPGLAPDRQPTVQEVENLIGRTVEDACNSLTSTAPWGQNWNYVKHYVEDVKNAGGNATVLEPGKYQVN